jgi:hypothetical protein
VHLLLTICQGAGLAAACGIRPFLPALLAGSLARADQGLDFEHTNFAFLEAPAFLLAVVIALVAVVVLERRRAGDFDAGPLAAAVAGVGAGLGALEFAGSLADEGHPSWPGILAGLGCALLAYAAVRQILGGAARRLDESGRRVLPVYADGASLLLAAVAIAVPPLAVLALAPLTWLLVRARGREGEKYAGLRILR